MSLRSIFRTVCYTANTIRYRVEWPRIREAWQQIGKVGTLFDGGAGSGEFARRVLVGGWCREVVALEYDAGNFVQLERNLGRDSRAKLIRGSLLEIPLADGSMDVVMCTQVIEHITEHEKAAGELARVLKPGGHAVITVPHPPEHFYTDDHKREGYSEEELAALFAPFGLTPLRRDWFLTRRTTNRMKLAWRTPLQGKLVPVAWVDCESGLTREARRADSPYGLLMLFQKNR